ncbi:MAG: hypothetical protein FWC68_04865, partial [Oscillospiraceae bacterium]|nr:hypothetical protein [Oscillospiraceae bacterium]
MFLSILYLGKLVVINTNIMYNGIKMQGVIFMALHPIRRINFWRTEGKIKKLISSGKATESIRVEHDVLKKRYTDARSIYDTDDIAFRNAEYKLSKLLPDDPKKKDTEKEMKAKKARRKKSQKPYKAALKEFRSFRREVFAEYRKFNKVNDFQKR